VSQSDGEPAWHGKTYNALKDKKHLTGINKEEESLVKRLSMQKIQTREWIFIGSVIALASPLFLLNLHNHFLWQDEAQTAVLAKTVMARGLPYGTDGRNLFSQELGAEYGDNYIWKQHTWPRFTWSLDL